MPKVSDAHRESRRTQIVEAALRCFATHGFHRTSMADIGQESGLSAGAIYLQFESKQAIAIAAAQQIMSHRVGDIQARLAVTPPPEPDEFIEAVMAGLAEEVHDSRLIVQLWGESFFENEMSSLIEATFARIGSVVGGYLEIWATARRGMTPEAAAEWARQTTPAMLGLMQGRILQWALMPSFTPEHYRRAVQNLFA